LADHEAAIASGRVFLLEVEGDLGGVLVIEAGSDQLFVEILAVAPAHQRHGLGGRLMAFAETEARRLGLRRVSLYTHQLMADAIAFYAALGYREAGRRTESGYARVYLGKDVGADPGSSLC
jgi:GNAT superfamily N-acetyltransferase